ncbi:MAG: hypothetical protein Q8N23_04310 [Archangium sp.]|nr:hypothetical protein [Archangium sp.]MDP3151865.1 hypothetical protein [Archangium sp.]MDP3574390.1 hypothetical protein [Archangium sp.]
MTVRSLQTLNQLFTRDDGRLETPEAERLLDASGDHGAVTDDERNALRSIASSPRTTAAARDVIETFLARPGPAAGLLNAVTGNDPGRFTDDRLLLGPDGTERGTSSVTPYTRSYDSVREGPMRRAHGSPAPRSNVLTADEQSRLGAQTPGEALDAMARARGIALGQGFVALANSKGAFDPTAPAWWGKCHAWAWSALSNELSARVDVGGPEGQRGLWLSGQWISRADLGNFLMGVSDTIALSDGKSMFHAPVTALDLLHASAQFLMRGGGGVVADRHNDAAHGGDREVWNQPFVAADLDTRTIDGEGALAVLALAANEGTPGLAVKHVHLLGRYGNEHADGWEGPWVSESRSWNLYAVTDATGAVVAAYAADDPQLEGVRGLPTRASHELPEYLWKPTLRAVEAGLTGTPDHTIDADPRAREYRFFVGTLLTRGVPGSTRSAFEAAVKALPPGPVNTRSTSTLLEAYPGVAAAYSAEQWERAFGSRGLSATVFGAKEK